MALYLVRAGCDGQFENRCIKDSRVYLRWGGLFADTNIAGIGYYEATKQAALAKAPSVYEKSC